MGISPKRVLRLATSVILEDITKRWTSETSDLGLGAIAQIAAALQRISF
jgi:hypothetical protein